MCRLERRSVPLQMKPHSGRDNSSHRQDVDMYMCFLLCLSLWYKIHESCEKGSDTEAGRGSVWKGGTRRGDGCGAWAADWLPVLRAGTACWHRAGARPQAIFSAGGKEVKGFKDKSNECRLASSSARSHSLTAFLFINVLWLCDISSCCLPEGSQRSGSLGDYGPGCARNAVFLTLAQFSRGKTWTQVSLSQSKSVLQLMTKLKGFLKGSLPKFIQAEFVL